ncbi:hypothetical protein [Methanobrevibacter sp.]
MTSKKNLAAAIMHTEKIDDFDEIISQNANITKKSFSHIVSTHNQPIRMK